MQDRKELSREDKITNTIINTSILLMGTLMGGLSEIMVNVTSEMAAGITEAFAGQKAGAETREKLTHKLPEVNDKMKAMISEMRKDIYAQMKAKEKDIAPFMNDPVFDLGPQTVDKYDFGIPKLTTNLDDDTLAKYSLLMIGEDAKFSELFAKLMDWLNSLPKTPDTPTKLA
jgi:hypothetical protein